MKIAIDVMGGDFAPSALLDGAKQYKESGGQAHLILVGGKAVIDKHFGGNLPNGCTVEHTEEYVEMGEHPVMALRRKKKASVAVCSALVKNKAADAMLSAGSTGAQMASSLLQIGKIESVERPAISVMLPSLVSDDGVLMLDVGANVDVKPKHLVQFALMGSIYYSHLYKVEKPRVALLNIGSEEAKGNDLTKEAYTLLSEEKSINFVGNIEADAVYTNEADVVVCDGFPGNVFLKTSESVAHFMQERFIKFVKKANLPAELMQAFAEQSKRFSPEAPEYSGAPLLGLNGTSIVCHGKAKASVIANAISLAADCAESGIIDSIRSNLAGSAT
ncbi:MAG: phosphate acyltransferase PlsX [Candidatus Riflebacteria bacterium]|nr:phosphate acyltransferase PlsX [Candidatus Riflebacteria bacterium]